jgi:uncharacterized protein (TIGR02147 family)
MKANTDIYAFLDYRDYLKAHVSSSKESNPAFSDRSIAYRLGCDAGFFNRVLNGKRNLNQEHILRLSSVLNLPRREQRYFELLVNYTQAQKQAEKDHYFEQLEVLRNTNITQVAERQYRLYTHWYYTVLREMLQFVHCSGSTEESAKVLSGLLEPKILPSEAIQALKVLEEERIIRKDSRGCFKSHNAFITSGGEIPSVVVNRVLLEFIDRAKEAVDRFPRTERDFSTLTFCVSPKGIGKIRKRIEEHRKELLAIVNEDTEAPDRVYHLNMNLFPVSKHYKDGRQ